MRGVGTHCKDHLLFFTENFFFSKTNCFQPKNSFLLKKIIFTKLKFNQLPTKISLKKTFIKKNFFLSKSKNNFFYKTISKKKTVFMNKTFIMKRFCSPTKKDYDNKYHQKTSVHTKFESK